jgi:hypothetical protein
MTSNHVPDSEKFIQELEADLSALKLGSRLEDCSLLGRARSRGEVSVLEPVVNATSHMFLSLNKSFTIQLSFYEGALGRVIVLPAAHNVSIPVAHAIIGLVTCRASAPSQHGGFVTWKIARQYEARLIDLDGVRHYVEVQSFEWLRMLAKLLP